MCERVCVVSVCACVNVCVCVVCVCICVHGVCACVHVCVCVCCVCGRVCVCGVCVHMCAWCVCMCGRRASHIAMNQPVLSFTIQTAYIHFINSHYVNFHTALKFCRSKSVVPIPTL